MNGAKKNNTGDLEAVAMISGLLVIACFVAAFFREEVAQVLFSVALGVGMVMNCAVAMIGFHRGSKQQCLLFALLTIVFGAVFVLFQRI